ncbi:uncharacterized protein LOC115227874 [Octopus sinensis]|uniref:Uncharacterized protein LOC115227874 n=1 Tax=Octopus sinensis TaxID=2607531 RepID=A0A6P7TQF4_9MOLL|nr:uncharacterized protein LOC115227874 [Octopus sinensis]
MANLLNKCLHLNLCRQYEIKKSKKLKTHSVQFVTSNEFVEIQVDTNFPTDNVIPNNKPEIFVHDKSSNTITLIEVGITSQNCLKNVEMKKFHKYDLLANQIGPIHRAKVKIVLVVITWNGIVSKFFKNHLAVLGVEDRVKAYIQTLMLRKTLEGMQAETKHGLSIPVEEVALNLDFVLTWIFSSIL